MASNGVVDLGPQLSPVTYMGSCIYGGAFHLTQNDRPQVLGETIREQWDETSYVRKCFDSFPRIPPERCIPDSSQVWLALVHTEVAFPGSSPMPSQNVRMMGPIMPQLLS